MGRSEVLEVEGEDRQIVPLRERHHAPVDEAEAEIGKAGVDLRGFAEKAAREERDGVLAGCERAQEAARRMGTDACTKKLVDLDQHRAGNEQVAAELGDKRCGEPMCPIAAIRRCDERARVGDDSQCAATRSWRYRSASRPRSSGPSPEAT